MRHTPIVAAVGVAGLLLGLVLQRPLTGQQQAGYVMEPAKRIPIVYEADVIVAGAGVSGVNAAIAAARNGARTVLVERYSSVAGTSGPGLNTGGGGQNVGIIEPAREAHVYPEIAGLPKEFTLRMARYRKEHGLGAGRLEDSHGVNYHATRMLMEAGVKILVSTWATDPIMEGNTVKGLFIENKSGRGAVTAKVVVDATGEADVARRAGAPILHPKDEYRELDAHAPNGIGLFAYVAGIDWDKYRAALKSKGNKFEGEFPPYDVEGLAKIVVSKSSPDFTLFNQKKAESVAGLKVQVVRPHGKVDAGNGLHIAALETAYRVYVYEVVQEIRKRVPGCENIYLVTMGEMGARGGPKVESEHVLTMDDAKTGRKFDDVIYVYGEKRALNYSCDEKKHCVFVDVPYRVMVPKKIDGLLAVGRSASATPDTLLRNRTAVQHMGEAGGTAAALAAKAGVTPRKLDVKQLQTKLLAAGYYLGDAQRLKALALPSN
jgi:ribulose 1,5-bisphosphate synthetase/thiazole synthase